MCSSDLSRSISNDNDEEEEEEFYVFDLVQVNNDNNNKASNSTKLTTVNAVDVFLNKKTTKELRVLFREAIVPKLALMNVSFGSMATRNITRNSLVVFLFNKTSTALTVVNFVEFVALLLLSLLT